MKRLKMYFALGMVCLFGLAMTGCTNTNQVLEPNESDNTKTIRTELQEGAARYAVTFSVPEEIGQYLTAVPSPNDLSSAGLILEKDGQSGQIGYLTIYDSAEYDDLKTQDVPLEQEALRSADGAVVLAYQGSQDSVFSDSVSAALVDQMYAATEAVVSSMTMEQIGALPESTNMDTVLQVGENRYTVSFAVPDYLQDYVKFGVWTQEDNGISIMLSKDGVEGNIGHIVLYDAKEYDALRAQNLPLETEVLRDDTEGVVLAYGGMQDAVFEQGTEQAELALQYHTAVGDILETMQLEKSA